MNKATYWTCQNLIRETRKREVKGGGVWSGKSMNARAETLYPNILAEMGWGLPWLRTPAEFANVSEEIMAAVLEDSEELSAQELWRLSHFMGAPLGYLTAPEMAFVDPATNKGKAKMRALADLVKQADGLDFLQWRVGYVLSSLEEGKTITYACYRWAIRELSDAITSKQMAKYKPRNVRRRTA